MAHGIKADFIKNHQHPIEQVDNSLALDKGTWISNIFPWSNFDKHLDKKSFQSTFHKQSVKGFFLGKTDSEVRTHMSRIADNITTMPNGVRIRIP
jgi:hypothetical protein